MSWMDSWSRPRKSQSVPPPLYLTPGGEATPYCRTCGRVISSRKTNSSNPVKYCSDRCRHHKPGPIDRHIEDVFVALLNGADPASLLDSESAGPGPLPKKEKIPQKKAKGDPRIIVLCETVETIVFGPRHDPTKVYGRKKNRATRALGEEKEWKTVDMEDDPVSEAGPGAASEESAYETDERGTSDHGGVQLDSTRLGGAGKTRPSQTESELNFSAMGGERGWAEKIEETEEMAVKRREGQRKAEEKEMVKRAARRGCAFGFVVKNTDGLEKHEGTGKTKNKRVRGAEGKIDEDEPKELRKKCEAIMSGQVVEASFAKGEWSIRWREEY